MSAIANKKTASLYRGQSTDDPYIFTKKTVYMQRIQDQIKAGCVHYIQGQIPLNKVRSLCEKFAVRYCLNKAPMADSRARKDGKNVARFLCYFDQKTKTAFWFLAYFPGAEPCKNERWLDPFASSQRIKLTGYELVRQTKKEAKKPVLTWRYTMENYVKMHEQIVMSIRNKHGKILDQLIFSLSKTPGFSGSREQVKNLWSLVKKEWKRRRSASEKPPVIPPTLGYVRRLPDAGMVWSELIESERHGSIDNFVKVAKL